jgi:uncharacterized membrane protein
MQRGRTSLLFLLFLACAAAFVWLTGQSLPDVVASHFGASGVADGFMPRGFYLRFMLAFVIGLPLLLLVVPNFALGSAGARINLPHREYWLAPERRAATVAFLRAHSVWFGAMLVVFLCYVHWLVVRANAVQPAHLSASGLIGGFIGFLAAILVWVKFLLGHFKKRS